MRWYMIGSAAGLVPRRVGRPDVLCKTRKGAVKARATCKPTETQLDPLALGLSGAQGPPGAQGPMGIQGPSAEALRNLELILGRDFEFITAEMAEKSFCWTAGTNRRRAPT